MLQKDTVERILWIIRTLTHKVIWPFKTVWSVLRYKILFSWLNLKLGSKSTSTEIKTFTRIFQVMATVYKYTIICKYLLSISICLTLTLYKLNISLVHNDTLLHSFPFTCSWSALTIFRQTQGVYYVVKLIL